MRLTPADMQAMVLHRDGLMLVLNKPAGIAVHQGTGKGPNLEAQFDALRYGLPRPPALAHRLDRDTSGCLILGRQKKALSTLGRLFQDGKIDKTYWALCVGVPEVKRGVIDACLRKQNAKHGWWMEVCAADAAGAMQAATEYEVLMATATHSLIAFKPRTGRTHQIRVHAAHLGVPLLGELKYGELTAEQRAALFCLHARRLVIPLYPTKPAIEVIAPPPPAFIAAVADYGLGLPSEL